MSIGYACMSVGVPETGFKTCTMKNADRDRLRSLIVHNLTSLENLIDYNAENNIRLFRISSDIIPFGSSPVNQLAWQDLFGEDFTRIGEKIRTAGMRVSMHPGQYTVLNSPDEDISRRAVLDLQFHACFLDALHTGPENKIVLHIGGAYGNKQEAARRFAGMYAGLDSAVRQRLVIENDEKSFSIRDVLDISGETGAPVVFDNLHHAVNPGGTPGSDSGWIRACAGTWGTGDGRQKIHYSQQAPGKKTGAHSDSIRIDDFLTFYQSIHGEELDIMLEVKDKNLSAVKCINCTADAPQINLLERDWGRYKYLILEQAPAVYREIRELLKNRAVYPAAAFYRLIEYALTAEADRGNSVNAAEHVWGYFKNTADEREKKQFFRCLEKLKAGETSSAPCKHMLLHLAQKYRQKYLLASLYFYI